MNSDWIRGNRPTPSEITQQVSNTRITLRRESSNIDQNWGFIPKSADYYLGGSFHCFKIVFPEVTEYKKALVIQDSLQATNCSLAKLSRSSLKTHFQVQIANKRAKKLFIFDEVNV